MAKGLDQEGTYYDKGTGSSQGASHKWIFKDSALKAFDLYAYDGYDKDAGDTVNNGNPPAEKIQPGAGFLKIHLGTALVAGPLTVRVVINDEVVFADIGSQTLS